MAESATNNTLEMTATAPDESPAQLLKVCSCNSGGSLTVFLAGAQQQKPFLIRSLDPVGEQDNASLSDAAAVAQVAVPRRKRRVV